MSIFNKILRRIVFKRLCSKGMHPYMAGDLREDYIKELLVNPERLSLKQRRWAWKRGFLAQKLNNYKLTEENCGDYLSDYDYYMLYPLNNRFSVWIDDKLTLRYVLDRFSEYLPNYYAAIDDGGKIRRLPDFPAEYPVADTGALTALLKSKKVLAAKPNRGSGGDGFYRLAYEDGGYLANDKRFDEAQFGSFLGTLGGYLITEYVDQCEKYKKVCSTAAHTLRIQTARTDSGEIELLFSFMRWGMDSNDFNVAHSTAGVNAAVDIERGEIKSAYYLDKDGEYHENLTRHPVSNALLTGEIPYWNDIVSVCKKIHSYLSELSYIGFDVIITDNGFKIIEINSHSGIRTYQHVVPFMKNERLKTYYTAKLKEKNLI